MLLLMFAQASKPFRRLGDATNAGYNRADGLYGRASRAKRRHCSRTRSGSPAPE
jgi:hypothetical protein